MPAAQRPKPLGVASREEAGRSRGFRNELLYTGRRSDPETGLQLNRHRFYHQQLGRWVNRDPLFLTPYSASIGEKTASVEFCNLYIYVANRPMMMTDPLGLKACGTFSWDPYKDPGRQFPGWQVGFDPTGCPPCKGNIKLVQVIDPHGFGSPGPFFDHGPKKGPKPTYKDPPPGTRYPGYCQTGGRCGKKNPKFPNVDGPIQDAPDIAPFKADGHSVTICAVCEIAPGQETVLGCINFETNEPQDGFNLIKPNTPAQCLKGGKHPAVDPSPIWDKADRSRQKAISKVAW